ncbi:MAG: type II secretion system GspH family protein [Phycisphaerales bacterium]|nr:type II secretion system GspH family protein [Phycisphaerales bacterium]
MRIAIPKKSGFTLIELLVAITIIALLISLVVVGLTSALRSAKSAGEKQSAASIKLGVEQFKQEFGFLPPLVLHDDLASPPIVPVGSYFDPSVSNNVPVVNVLGGGKISNPTINSSWFLEGFMGDGRAMTSDGRLNSGTLAGRYVADTRFSEYSLAYYLVGALPAQVDGAEGPGFTTPAEDGTFETKVDSRSTRVKNAGGAKRVYSPLVDIARGSPKLDVSLKANVNDPSFPVRYRLIAPNGTPYRYYRWAARKKFPTPAGFLKWDFTALADAPEDEADRLGVPSLLGDPRENSELRGAEFAIVSAGPNAYFGDMPLEAKADSELLAMQAAVGVPVGIPPQIDENTKYFFLKARTAARRDNIVEVGR